MAVVAVIACLAAGGALILALAIGLPGAEGGPVFSPVPNVIQLGTAAFAVVMAARAVAGVYGSETPALTLRNAFAALLLAGGWFVVFFVGGVGES